MDIKRGYVKWTDENGVFHKEPLYLHPDLLATATDEQKRDAEAVRVLTVIHEYKGETLPPAFEEDDPENAQELELGDPELWSEDHEEALDQLEEVTT